tara:strand:+ start:10173 stop:10979 length:807 start_codon:yes stop_codon:yes gene_type:complete
MINTKSNLLILIPPSEGKNKEGTDKALNITNLSFKELNVYREKLINNLISIMKTEFPPKLLGVKNIALEEAIFSNLSIYKSFTMPAISRYTGVMYDAINYGQLNDFQKSFFNQNVLIISGLFGILRPDDLIPNYKLKMSANLGSSSCANLWKKPITKLLSKIGEKKEIWDFLPIEHSKAINFDNVNYFKRYKVNFCQMNKGEIKTVTHWSKFLRGIFINNLCILKSKDNYLDTNEIIKTFEKLSKYKLMDNLSKTSKNDSIFTFLKEE